MNDLFGFLTASQDQIKVLGAVILMSEFTCLFQKRTLYGKNMTDVIAASQKVDIVIRLKAGIKIVFSVHGDFIFICINNICVPVFVDGFYNLKKCVPGHYIVMIRQHNIFS